MTHLLSFRRVNRDSIPSRSGEGLRLQTLFFLEEREATFFLFRRQKQFAPDAYRKLFSFPPPSAVGVAGDAAEHPTDSNPTDEGERGEKRGEERESVVGADLCALFSLFLLSPLFLSVNLLPPLLPPLKSWEGGREGGRRRERCCGRRRLFRLK